jgi:hypothetical protein
VVTLHDIPLERTCTNWLKKAKCLRDISNAEAKRFDDL